MTGRLTTAGLTRLLNTGITQAGFPYVILGSGSQAFSEALTALNAEVLGKVSTLTGADTFAALRSFYTNSEANATISEVALRSGVASGTLYGYANLPVSVIKDASRSYGVNWVQALRNQKLEGFFTAYGLRAIRGGGCTTTTLPYIAVHEVEKTFREYMTDPGTELARVAVATVSVSTVTVTITSVAFGAGVGTGTWKAISLWSASSGGNLLAYVRLATAAQYVKGAGDSRKAIITFVLENQP